ncbi:flagellar basal body rod protein : Flagellar basal-body rod protein FlgC OS=Marinitoga piezophila (strain DSM 14283 / JCM 11233 / KA3) GN=Marpi_1604 PE=4 SV=1: Flg_bb_rod: Flg_bbr_C [Gemmata massiliana]|uniref:Flagellar basal-body rod protein FlgC n=1 Tax=Gemmata massiliana TaxID=1210884 RepID=A0A6P2D4Y6_9BACT|nr:flagellar basal body rod protein FlgC [Gemmata massiliana]VTR96361.1 flagellar basal body rod protein : Flagellar basal-body rod protein FlgC OS=Marinitoga piezophila (strain DSM 14283 / JCM 11233 / KA3) GN=Marpi_1604 PE=4 SV=1: Flg_bb_rod: Flg_bbr_C [Gemmata massiliana]
MPFNDLFAATAISSSGMSAERLRMEVVANNIANANTTRSANGGPYRRQDVVFAEVLGAARGGPGGNLRGVEAVEMIEDPSDLPSVYQPGHPDADAAGNVRMPNVQLPIEMVNLLTAARAYEANLRTAQTFRQMNEQALALLRG